MAPRILSCCLAVLALAFAGCGEEEEAAPGATATATATPTPTLTPTPTPTPTELTVRVDPDGRGPEPARETRLRCGEPPEGRACAAAARLRPADLEPVPGDVACTEIFGGPQTATIAGTLDSRPVSARFSRQNGCEIARWDVVAPLLETAR